MPLFLLFLIVPLIEIGLFIQVGGWLGLWPTLLIVVLTAIAGTRLLRQQGRGALQRLQQSLSELSDPSEPLASGAMILFAGALLLTPGFFTDAFGLALMVPKVRAWIFERIKARVTIVAQGNPAHSRPDIIDAEFEDISSPRRDGPSKWTEH